MDKIYLYIFYTFRFFINYTPRFIINSILDLSAWIVYKIDKKHKKVAMANLELAFDNQLNITHKDDIVKNCYKNLFYMMADFVRNQGITKEELLNKISFENDHYIKQAIAQNKKIIIMTAHYSNWEHLGLAISAKYIPMTSVGRDLDTPSMNEILKANRKQLGMEIISKKGAMKGMIQALKKDRAVGILVDQNTTENEGILIDFFGKKARHTPSVALLAKKFDALILPVFIQTDNYKNYTVKFYEPFNFEDTGNKEQDIKDCVQKQADITQLVIEEKPNEWFWFHQRWKNQYEHIYQ